MRIVPFLLSLLITISLIIALSIQWASVPPLGSFLSPQHGFWLNAEPVEKNYSADLAFPGLEGKATVYFDSKMIPHVFAEEDNDAYFVQGYLHAKFRLWQMEFQTLAAAGRLTEVLGAGPNNAYLNHDRNMRRLGMIWAARNSLQSMESDKDTKTELDAYTAGVNSFLTALTNKDLPLEYRLLHYYPEKWTNLKTALFLKYMSYDLAGQENDIEYTNAKSVFPKRLFDLLYPVRQDSLDPIIPAGTLFDTAGVKIKPPVFADSLYFNYPDSFSITSIKPNENNGSNNWAVSGMKTKSGRPILCNDPHLDVNLPSLWYEMQITTKNFSVYGVSFPGAPSIIIGFNDSIAWGVTNAMRDVRDYYSIKFRDDSKKEYWYNNEWKAVDKLTIETYKIRNDHPFYDTVAYTAFGPVMFDASYNGNGRSVRKGALAVRWKAHEASNELKTFSLLNRAHNYDDYRNAILNFNCPGQNFIFASKDNTIAIWQEADFPAKWKRQGDFIMPGNDNSYEWQASIPRNENPHLINPQRGFVSSANQMPVDTTYPYYIGGRHDLYRGKMINRYLSGMNGITIADMKKVQTDNFNLFAQTAMPVLSKYINRNELSDTERKYLDIVESWNLRDDPMEKGPAIFTTWFDNLEHEVWDDELSKVPRPVKMPSDYTLIEALLRDSSFTFIDNINTSAVETILMVVTAAFRKAVPSLEKAEKQGKLAWTRFKDSGVRHLLRIPALSRFHLITGGGVNVINATQQFHAPSWRMIVQLTDSTEAFGIYPGGQSGNPGSIYYDTFIDDWAAGRYNAIWVMRPEQVNDPRIAQKISFRKN